MLTKLLSRIRNSWNNKTAVVIQKAAMAGSLLSLDGAEALERRRMLAGNVNVRVAGNNLTVTGDGAANQIQIISSGSEIVVTGDLNTNVRRGNTGITANSLGNLTIRMRGGDDSVTIQPGFDVNGNLKIATGAGSDFTRIRGQRVVNGNTSARTAGGQDLFYVDATDFAGSFRLMTGGGNDFVLFGDSTGAAIGFAGPVNISMGGGSDALEFESFTTFTFSTNSRLVGGGGFDNLFPQTASFQAMYPNVGVSGFEF